MADVERRTPTLVSEAVAVKVVEQLLMSLAVWLAVEVEIAR